jgi:excisionase family DNA binding protein
MLAKHSETPRGILEDIPERPQTADELAEWVGTSRRFIEGEVQRGNLRARKIGSKLVRFLRSDIADWLNR